MLDRGAAESPGRAAASLSCAPARTRRRALMACAAVALALHAVFIGNIGGSVPGEPGTALAPMSLRTLPEEPVAAKLAEPMAEASVAAAPAAPSPLSVPGEARAPRPARESAATVSRDSDDTSTTASANSKAPTVTTATAAARDSPAPAAAEVAIVAEAAASGVGAAVETPPVPAPGAAGARPPLLGPGDEPPPLYRTRLPPSLTLHYQVRRGSLRGTGQIRWTAAGDHYRLALEAQVAGLTLLMQTSEGDVGPDGLAPLRFLDRRARRSAQAANFRREDGRVTFSGSGVEWPLLAGSQDRLSWMIQLAGIAAAEPGLLVDGGRITMVVIGARGDAGIWAFHCVGRETIDTGRGSVRAVKLVRAGRSAYDTSAEIWLDPEQSYLPVHATLRNGDGGALEYDLLLERVEPE